MQPLVAVGSELQRAVTLRERSRNLLAHGAGIGHEEHQREFLTSLSSFWDKQIILHCLARLGVAECKLFELAQCLSLSISM